MGCSLHFYKEKGNAEFAPLCRIETGSMTYGNAQAALTALGLEYDLQDPVVLPLATLEEACRLFLTSELAAYVDGGTASEKNGIVYSFGRRPGYITERVQGFVGLCERARQMGAVNFGFF